MKIFNFIGCSSYNDPAYRIHKFLSSLSAGSAWTWSNLRKEVNKCREITLYSSSFAQLSLTSSCMVRLELNALASPCLAETQGWKKRKAQAPTQRFIPLCKQNNNVWIIVVRPTCRLLGCSSWLETNRRMNYQWQPCYRIVVVGGDGKKTGLRKCLSGLLCGVTAASKATNLPLHRLCRISIGANEAPQFFMHVHFAFKILSYTKIPCIHLMISTTA